MRIGGDFAHEHVMALLADPEPAIRVGTVVGTMGNAHPSRSQIVQQLAHWAVSTEPAARLTAARAIGEIGVPDFNQYLLDLLNDSDDAVRRAALVAAGQVASPSLWPTVIALCDRPGSTNESA